MAEKHFVLLESQNSNKQRDTLQLSLSGYSDVVFLIGDIVKVCLLALEAGAAGGTANVPEPNTNISGVLSIILDLLPYEEAELLDHLRAAVLHPAETSAVEEEYFLENIFLTVPTGLR